MVALYALLFGTLVVLRHASFVTQTWDLGIFVQTFWNASHGRGLVNTIEQVPHHLGVHFSPVLYLLVPGYALFQGLSAQAGLYYLLLVQTLALALGAWPLYLLAKRILARYGVVSSFWPLALSAGYLLSPSLHALNLFDFHEAALIVPLLLGALYFLDAEKWLSAGLFLVLSAGVKEEAPLVILFVGLFLLVTARHSLAEPPASVRTRRMIAGGIALCALLYFFLVIKVFMPAEGGALFRIDRYAELGETGSAIITTVFTNPLLLLHTVATLPKVTYVFWLLLPVLFLPLLSWRALLLLVPGLAENLLTNYAPQFSGLYHYDAMLIPGMFVATIYGVGALLTRFPQKEKIFCALFLGTLGIGFLAHSPIRLTQFPTDYFTTTPQTSAYQNLVRLVPPTVSVSAHTNLVPHLASREKVYVAGAEPEQTDVVLLNTADLFGFGSEEVFANYLKRYETSGNYNLYVFDDRYIVLLNKKLQVKGLPAQAKQ